MSKVPVSFVSSAILPSTRCRVSPIVRVILNPRIIIRISSKTKKNSREYTPGLLLDSSVWNVMRSISTEEISGIYFLLNVVQYRIITISDDTPAHFLELPEVVDNLRTEECAAAF